MKISVILKVDFVPSGAQTTLQSIINKYDTFIFARVKPFPTVADYENTQRYSVQHLINKSI